MKNCILTGQTVTIRSSENNDIRNIIEALAGAIAEEIGNEQITEVK